MLALPLLPLARWTAGTPCGYYLECERNYTAQDVDASASSCPAGATRALEQARRRARVACEASDSVLSSGGWCLTKGEPNVQLDRNQSYYLPVHHGVADGIVVGVLKKLLRRRASDDGARFWSITDFGAGVGQYGHALLSFDDFPYRGYDGAGNAEQVSGGFLRFVDFTLPLCLPRTDWVMSLEVGEHVPPEHEASYVRNLHAHNCRGVILSWAKPRQAGHSHVNNHANAYVIRLFEELGYEHLQNLTRALRWGQRHAVPGWHQFRMLRYTLLAFRRITPLQGDGCTSASSKGDWSFGLVE